MIRDLKSLIFQLQHRKNYPNVKIEFGARVVDSTFGSGVEIGTDCYIQRSRFSAGVMIKNDCVIFDSEFEKQAAIYPHCVLHDVRIGSYSYMNEHCTVRGVRVGNFTSIGPHFFCGHGGHPTNFVTTSPVFYSTRGQCGVSFAEKNLFDEQHDTFVGNDVWIGARVFVRDGVRIGNGALIAAGAVVVADVPDYAMVGGIPAKLIRYRFPEEIIRELSGIEWWNWSEAKLREAQPLLSQPDVTSFLKWARQQEHSP